MVSGISPVGITQNERFWSCDTVLIGVRHVIYFGIIVFFLSTHLEEGTSKLQRLVLTTEIRNEDEFLITRV
jgi:hypothetical protein